MAARQPAFIQVDVDGLWAVRQCYARPVRDTFRDDPVWTQGIPEFRRLFARLDVPAGFFVVGRDMGRADKRRLARDLAADGHEIANHSWSHRIGITRLPWGALWSEIGRGHDAIARAGLPAPRGFRAPGYDVDARVLRALADLGYAYDASMLPTRLAPLLRLADAWLSRRWQPGKRQFGRVAYGSAPRVPYRPNRFAIRRGAREEREDSGILEIPVSTLAPLHLPLTASSIFALGPEKTVAKLAAMRDRPLLMLLHGIDLVDCARPIVFDTRRPGVGGFNLSLGEKLRMIEPVLEYVCAHWRAERADAWATSLDRARAQISVNP